MITISRRGCRLKDGKTHIFSSRENVGVIHFRSEPEVSHSSTFCITRVLQAFSSAFVLMHINVLVTIPLAFSHNFSMLISERVSMVLNAERGTLCSPRGSLSFISSYNRGQQSFPGVESLPALPRILWGYSPRRGLFQAIPLASSSAQVGVLDSPQIGRNRPVEY